MRRICKKQRQDTSTPLAIASLETSRSGVNTQSASPVLNASLAISLSARRLPAREFEPLPCECCFFALRKAPDDVAIRSSVIHELGYGFVEVEHYVKLAIPVEAGIVQIVVAQPGRISQLHFREPLPSSLSQRLRGTLTFLPH